MKNKRNPADVILKSQEASNSARRASQVRKQECRTAGDQEKTWANSPAFLNSEILGMVQQCSAGVGNQIRNRPSQIVRLIQIFYKLFAVSFV
jgi:hypothetical protein